MTFYECISLDGLAEISSWESEDGGFSSVYEEVGGDLECDCA